MSEPVAATSPTNDNNPRRYETRLITVHPHRRAVPVMIVAGCIIAAADFYASFVRGKIGFLQPLFELFRGDASAPGISMAFGLVLLLASSVYYVFTPWHLEQVEHEVE